VHTLSTALSAFFALLSTALAYIAFSQAQRANDAQIASARAAGKLNAMAGRVIALEGALESLQAQHRKLSGKFHAAQHSETPPSADVGLAPAELRKPATPEPAGLQYCDNWEASLVYGPKSPEAKCDCAYCNWRRAERARTRAELMPAARTATLGVSKP
jgi:hypothetical protein